MKKIIKYIVSITIIVLSFFFTFSLKINALSNQDTLTPSKNGNYDHYSYVIDKYDVNIVVNENNTFDITETITAYFNTYKHGIVRSIPLKNNISRLDGSSDTTRAQVYNVSVNNEYSVSRSNNNYNLQIGSASKTVTGSQTYVIKYTYNLGKDYSKDYDELYFNIIGTEWDTVIGNVTFSITMPKEFDTTKLGFSSGKYGSTDNSNIEYTVNENTITGKYNAILYVNNGLTVRCELPEGYFIGAGLKVEPIYYVLFALPFICLIIAFFLWKKYGKDDLVVETVEFYPPDGLNSLDVGFLYKGEVENKDVTSLLVYLANEGYLEIEDSEGKNEFTIKKLKDYSGKDANERIFMEGLFKNNRNEVTDDDLYNEFYTTNESIINRTNKKKWKIFKSPSTVQKILILLMALISFTAICIPPINEYFYEPLLVFFVSVFVSIAAGIFYKWVLLDKPKSIKVLGTIFSLGLVGSIFFVFIYPALMDFSQFLIFYTLGFACIVGILICYFLMPKRTQYGTRMIGKIKGFKNFLEVAEKEQLEARVLENPNYFYDILPYAYVLGVSDKWIKKFECISLYSPSWYVSYYHSFTVGHFGKFMNRTMHHAEKAMTSVPAPPSSGDGGFFNGFSIGGGSSRGGFSGGEFSGGGHGGGGGHSW